MAFMEWSETYSVNVAEIDEQHKRLITLINELYEAAERGGSEQTVRAAVEEFETITFVVDALIDYTLDHFSVEERHMERLAYPGYEDHRAAHKAAIEKVHAFQREIEEGKALTALQIATFLKRWLQTHILDVDQRLGAFLRERGVD